MADLYLCDNYDCTKNCLHKIPHEHRYRCYFVPIVCDGAQCIEVQDPDTDYECNLDGHWKDPARLKQEGVKSEKK